VFSPRNIFRSILMAVAVAVIVFGGAAWAQVRPKSTGESGLPIPRFVSLASAKVNMRVGPGVRYPIAWVYRRADLPLMVTAEYQYWRKVRDHEGTEGWMHKSLLSGRRYGIVVDGIQPLRADPSPGAGVVARLQKGVIVRLESCAGAWCRAQSGEFAGWLERKAIYGVLPKENFE
jgi:SH3-like domain-containing protein